MLCVLLFIVTSVFGQKEQCDLIKAEKCAVDLQTQFDEAYMEYERQETHEITVKISNLCSSILKGSVTTECYDDNIKLCDNTESQFIKVQWEETRKDILEFCNRTICENFENFKTCKEIIYEKGTQDYQFERFCRTYNESVECAMKILDNSCLFSIQFYNSLIYKPTHSHYKRVCLAGCANLDDTVQAISSCMSHNIDRSATECERHINLKTCLYSKTDVCPEVGKLISWTRYDELSIQCTTTTATTVTTSIPTPTTESMETTSLSTNVLTMVTTTETTESSTSQTFPISTESNSLTTIESKTRTEKPVFTAEYKHTEKTDMKTLIFSSTDPTLETSSTRMNYNTYTKDMTEQSSGIKNQETIAVTSVINLETHVNNCLHNEIRETSFWNVSTLDFPKCIATTFAIACLHSNVSEIREISVMLSLLPEYVIDFIQNGNFYKCKNIINGFSAYVERIEYSCIEQKIQTGCTGHNYGVLDCYSNNGISLSSSEIKWILFLLYCTCTVWNVL